MGGKCHDNYSQVTIYLLGKNAAALHQITTGAVLTPFDQTSPGICSIHIAARLNKLSPVIASPYCDVEDAPHNWVLSRNEGSMPR